MRRLVESVLLIVIGLAIARPHTTLSARDAVVAFTPPDGEFGVGTTTWHVSDPARRETFSGGTAAREVEVLAWYPIAKGGNRSVAPYLRNGLAEAQTFGALLKAEHAFDGLADVKAHGELDAPPVPNGAALPIMLFSHGYTDAPSAHTALAEDMASHGYVFLSVVHPYEATAVTLANGRIAKMLDDKGAFPPTVQSIFQEWAKEDEAMAVVSNATDRDEQTRLLRGYLATMPKTKEMLARWVADEQLVLDRLSNLPKGSAAAALAERLDLSKIGVFGHSMGGVAAAEFCRVDRRCKAGFNFDGSPQHGTLIELNGGALPVPFMMVYSARPGRAGVNDAIYARATTNYTRVDVAGTAHLDFGDMTFWGGPLKDLPVLGTIGADRAQALQRRITREFFDKTLLGKSASMLDGTTKQPEVTVTRFGSSGRLQ